MGRGHQHLSLATLFGILVFTLSFSASAKERLVLAGGGGTTPNKAAIQTIVRWASELGGKILRINWASETIPGEPEEQPSSYPFPENSVIDAVNRFDMAKNKKLFLEKQLPQASAVFFTGGDQIHIMDVLKDDEIRSALVSSFKNGIVFAGTSAGLAIMSRKMFTGHGSDEDIDAEAPVLADGLGLLPGVMLDQHFIKRKRLNRLLSAMLKKIEPVGVGVDEDSAVAIEDGRYMTVLGPKKVVVIDSGCDEERFSIGILSPGDEYDLSDRKVLKTIAKR